MIDGTGFVNSIEVQSTRLNLSGVAMLRYLVFTKAYAGALYLPKDLKDPRCLMI